MRTGITWLSLGIIFYCTVLPAYGSAYMESPRFRIEESTVGVGKPAEKRDSLQKKETYVLPESFIENGLTIKAVQTASAFRISSGNITFPPLKPNKTVTQKISVEVVPGSHVFSVQMAAEHELRRLTGETIPHTRCDGALESCTTAIARQWISSSAYGFGYRLSTMDKDHYKALPDLSDGQQPVTILSVSGSSEQMAELTFKLNTSSLQADGTYETIVRFTGSPVY